MRSPNLLTAGELREVLSTPDEPLPAARLHAWVVKGIVTPTVDPGGSGRDRLYRIVPDALAVAAVLGLRANGFELSTCAAVAEALQHFDDDSLRVDLDAGRKCMVLLDGSPEAACSRLLRPDAATAAVAEFEAGNTIGLRPAVLDVGKLYANVLGAVDAARARAEAELVG